MIELPSALIAIRGGNRATNFSFYRAAKMLSAALMLRREKSIKVNLNTAQNTQQERRK